ncbi:MAG: hypothetical protein JO208_05185, partial [Alphaproteobacteria bacterium]|nr:hypothetical protein [Alphaproteobacteria bacterium]
AWLYERFGRPDLDVAGEVLTNLATAAVPDWIQISTPDDTAEVAVTRTSLPPVVIRGACAVSPLLHYFQMQAQEITGEFNTIRDSVHHIRVDHSLMLRHALDGVSPAQMKILQELGFEAEDFQTRFNGPQGVRILSSWVDVQPIVYRHKATGLMVPYKVKIGTEEIDPMIDPAPGTPEFEDMPERAQNALRYLRNNFEHIGVLPPETLQQNFEIISAFVSDGSLMFALLAQETKKRDERGTELNRRIQQLNEIIHRVAARNPRIIPIGISEMASEEERRGRGHFHRSVYHRLYGEITARVATEFARNANAQTAVNLKEPDPVRIDQPPPHPTSTVHIPEVRILRDTF